MRDKKVSILVEGALMVAASFLLSLVKVYEAPYGGSVTLGSMVPILIYSARHGVYPGLLAGAVEGIVQLILEPYIVHPVQVVLDYPLAFGLLGLAGLFRQRVILGSFVGILGRFISHFLSGVIFFSQYAPKGMSPYLYSLLYNGAYLLPEFIVSAVVLRVVLYSFVKKSASA
ncbi:MAG: energy-coupled thiamine transporter ThiT [Candidatus Fermentithermobacillus carboniphilus]|uniref:Energy-coupled thiamine transporter ThiT n=1 Tax=Candidatus Fermentithermobacillus carboniphilus TaxID=3085328 RepID=A0AAT9LD17_9FIRM|nr:MAG: energy-coupled thiamine transporter ThiT [Candidatus Fermentithermobacillus carboniphilus]